MLIKAFLTFFPLSTGISLVEKRGVEDRPTFAKSGENLPTPTYLITVAF